MIAGMYSDCQMFVLFPTRSSKLSGLFLYLNLQSVKVFNHAILTVLLKVSTADCQCLSSFLWVFPCFDCSPAEWPVLLLTRLRCHCSSLIIYLVWTDVLNPGQICFLSPLCICSVTNIQYNICKRYMVTMYFRRSEFTAPGVLQVIFAF